MRYSVLLAFVLDPTTAAAQSSTLPPRACERLAPVSLPNATITMAQVVAAGAFIAPPPNGGGGASGQGFGDIPPIPGRVTPASAGLGLGYNGGRGVPQFWDLSPFCRVGATLRPSADSDIRMELWLPLSEWDGNFRGTSPNGLAFDPPPHSIMYAYRGAVP